jgi:hypothetical protein
MRKTLVQPSDFDALTEEYVARHDKSTERPYYYALSYFVGVARLGRGASAEAASSLRRVDRSSPYFAYAQRCLALAGVRP